MGCKPGKDSTVHPIADLEVFLKYDFVAKLGTGATSQVHEGSCKQSKRPVAIKCIVKEEAEAMGRHELKQEALLMRRVEHDNICRLYEMLEDDLIVYFVLELLSGGTLFDRLESDIVLEEAVALRISRQMVSAVLHMHERSIVHRDLKPENWLFTDFSDKNKIKLINFGLAETCATFTQPCGTLHYVAPEVLRGSYGQPADIWTLGVVTFLMLYAAYPFDGESCQTVLQSILGSEPDWADSCYALSADVMDFLKKTLLKDPDSRLTANQALQHGWFKAYETISGSPSLKRLPSNLNRRLSASIQLEGLPKAVQAELPQIKGAPGQGRRMSTFVTSELIRECQKSVGHGTGGHGNLLLPGGNRGSPLDPAVVVVADCTD
mmetsp:Transcript_39420/g.125307  ORF Transcript_39420/g.125307 Transcript_39420/m.125307 type:complete len:378 (-) Transcript_39420:129-1262(-)